MLGLSNIVSMNFCCIFEMVFCSHVINCFNVCVYGAYSPYLYYSYKYIISHYIEEKQKWYVGNMYRFKV